MDHTVSTFQTAPSEALVVPVLAEQIAVATCLVESGAGVRVHKRVLE